MLLQDYVSVPTTCFPKGNGALSAAGPIMACQAGPANGAAFRARQCAAFVRQAASSSPTRTAFFYTFDKATKKFTSYIDAFGKIYGKFVSEPPFGMGLVSFIFDPDYAHNGKFYTVHTERVPYEGVAEQPDGSSLPGLDLTGFTTTAAINPPAGDVGYEAVVTEWTDTNIKDATFQGTAREILREGINFGIHPYGRHAVRSLGQAWRSGLRQSLYLHRRRQLPVSAPGPRTIRRSGWTRLGARSSASPRISISGRRTCSAPMAVTAFPPPARIPIRLSRSPMRGRKFSPTVSATRTG